MLAALFAAATAWVVWKIGCRYVGRWTAVLPAIFYVIWQEPFNGGGGGQSAIFYNLLTALCAFLALQSGNESRSQPRIRNGAAAMLLMGIAIQIKYTVLPEGIFFGCYFLWVLRRERTLMELLGIGAAYVAIALLPTIGVCLYYLAIGHFDAFFYANFLSVFDRGALVSDHVSDNLTYILIAGLPLIVCGVLGFVKLASEGGAAGRDAPFLFGWAIAAAAGFLMISNFYWYYFMPVILTLSVLMVPLLRSTATGILAVLLLTIWPLWISDTPSWSHTADRKASIADLTAMIRPYVSSSRDCLYVFDGPSALYLTSNSCLPTSYVYPDHLSNDVERTGLGIDAAAEMQRVLNSRPGAIVTAEKKVVPILNEANVRALDTALRSDYRMIGRRRHGWRVIRVYARRDLVDGQR